MDGLPFELRVTNVTTRDKARHEGIVWLSGPDWEGQRKAVVDDINNGLHAFYTEEGGKRAYVHVRGPLGNQWVQTYADGQWQDNLLSLPPCPKHPFP